MAVKKEEHRTSGGAQRSVNAGKGRYDLIPTRPLRRLAKHYENGVVQGGYEPHNWENGYPFSDAVSSAKRHLDQFIEGEKDEDHLAAATFHLFALMDFLERHPELNDLPDHKAPTACPTCNSRRLAFEPSRPFAVCMECLVSFRLD